MTPCDWQGMMVVVPRRGSEARWRHGIFRSFSCTCRLRLCVFASSHSERFANNQRQCSARTVGTVPLVGLAVLQLGDIIYVPCMIAVVTPTLYGINVTEVTLPRKYGHGPSPSSNVAIAVAGIRTQPNSR